MLGQVLGVRWDWADEKGSVCQNLSFNGWFWGRNPKVVRGIFHTVQVAIKGRPSALQAH